MTRTWDFVIIGSGFGGSVSALRLAERGRSVLLLERGRRFDDQDFASSSWDLPRYLWAPSVGCYGILQISAFRDVFVLHGAGVGGGSLGYANVLMQPTAEAFEQESWRRPVHWGEALEPHYVTARRMLGVATNPRLGPADETLRGIARELGREASFQPVPVGAFFGEPGHEGKDYPDPYFGGAGPARRSCNHCGGCMVGCRHGAKNTLPKNYLWLAEKAGAEIQPFTTVTDIRPVDGAGDARYEVYARSTKGFGPRTLPPIRARNVIVSAGALGTPIIAPDVGDVARIFGAEAASRLVRQQEVTDYARLVLNALADGEEQQRVTEALSHRVRTEYSMERMVSRTADVWRKATGQLQG